MIPESLKVEARFAEDVMPTEKDRARLGMLSEQACPECAGPLLRTVDDIVRFRCLTGHAFSGATLDTLMRKEVREPTNTRRVRPRPKATRPCCASCS